MAIGQRLLDDGDASTDSDLAGALRALILRMASEAVAEHDFPEPSDADVALQILAGEQPGVTAKTRLEFGDDGALRVGATIGFSPDGNQLNPTLKSGILFQPDGRFRESVRSKGRAAGAFGGLLLGALLGGPFGAVAGGLFGSELGADAAEAKAKAAVHEAVTHRLLPALQEALRLPDEFFLDPDRHQSRVRLSYCGPVVGEARQFLAVGLDVDIRTKPSRTIPGLTGPVSLGGILSMNTSTDHISVSLTADLVNTVLYAFWQTGQLRRWLSEPEFLAKFNAAVQHLPVRVEYVDPILPPVLQPSTAAPRRDLALRGDFRARLVARRGASESHDAAVFVGVGLKEGNAAGADPAVALDLRDLVLSCVQPAEGGHETRTPCFADTVQMARSWGGLDTGHLEAVRSQVDELLSRLKPTGSESPIRLALSGVTPRIEPGAPPTVRLDGRLRVTLR